MGCQAARRRRFQARSVGFNQPFYQLMARFYYTLEAIGEVNRLDTAIFDAIHVKGLKLIDDKSVLEWVTAQGQRQDFFRRLQLLWRDEQDQTRRAAGASVKDPRRPAIVVDGRYLVVGQDIKSHSDLLALTDKVIDKRRSERNPKKK